LQVQVRGEEIHTIETLHFFHRRGMEVLGDLLGECYNERCSTVRRSGVQLSI